MGCNAWECGTGLTAITLPSDPSNNVVLSAIGVSGGVRVSWTYPTTNPHAIAFVKLFRGKSSVFANALSLSNVSSSYYVDIIPDNEITEYFYWIQLISVNGTELEVIGPKSATPLSSAAGILETLTGKIDSGVLATSLRTEIDRITSLSDLLNKAKEDWTFRDIVLAEALQNVEASAGQALTQVIQETLERKSEHEALIDQVNLIMASIDGTIAAVLEETKTLATDQEALASQLAQAEVSLAGQVANVQTNMETSINTLDGKVINIGALYTAKVSVNGLVGGFGVYNNGRQIEAGFDVDTFWVGRTNSNKVKPFIIANDVVYIDKARIRDADIDTMKIAGNAVTIPVSGYNASYGAGSGMNNFNNGVYVTLPAVSTPMQVSIVFTAAVGYSGGSGTFAFKIRRGSTVIYNSGAMAGNVMAINLIDNVPANTTNTYYADWAGSSSSVICNNFSLTILGIRR